MLSHESAIHPGADAELVGRLRQLRTLFRPTPTVRIDLPDLELHAKLEFQNPIGSIKDRTAYWVLLRAAERGQIRTGGLIIESSSGNFAIALAVFARLAGLRFIAVVDPNIVGMYESILTRCCERVVKVTERDDTGGFLKTRLRTVRELIDANAGSYWPNQYGNPDAVDAHYHLTAPEICGAFDRLELAFIGVSTAGTIAGVSRRLKEHFQGIRIIAVDSEGSVIFGGPPKPRFIPGIGASLAPELLSHAQIDEVIVVPERDAVAACDDLARVHGIFAGGSSGTVYAAARRYVPAKPGLRAVFLCADRGSGYIDSVYDPVWARRLLT